MVCRVDTRCVRRRAKTVFAGKTLRKSTAFFVRSRRTGSGIIGVFVFFVFSERVPTNDSTAKRLLCFIRLFSSFFFIFSRGGGERFSGDFAATGDGPAVAYAWAGGGPGVRSFFSNAPYRNIYLGASRVVFAFRAFRRRSRRRCRPPGRYARIVTCGVIYTRTRPKTVTIMSFALFNAFPSGTHTPYGARTTILCATVRCAGKSLNGEKNKKNHAFSKRWNTIFKS